MRQLLHKLPENAGSVAVGSAVQHRLQRVLRLDAGARVILGDGAGATVEVQWNHNVFEPIGPRMLAPQQAPQLHMAVGLIKGERWDWCVEKLAELGVNQLFPLDLDHCVVRSDPDKSAGKATKWQQIATDAFEQCGSPFRMHVHEVMSFSQWIAAISGAHFAVCDELRPPMPISRYLSAHGDGVVRVIVGPEGGLSISEKQQAAAAGGVAVRLGENVLRAETAAIAAATLVRCVVAQL